MAYCTQSNLTTAFGTQLLVDLTDDEQAGSLSAECLARIAAAIADADAFIDGHLRTHYDVPLATTPVLIRKLSKDLAIFYLFQRRSAAFELPEWLTASHQDARDTLALLRKGELDLGVEPVPAESAAAVAAYDGPDRLFTADTLEDF